MEGGGNARLESLSLPPAAPAEELEKDKQEVYSCGVQLKKSDLLEEPIQQFATSFIPSSVTSINIDAIREKAETEEKKNDSVIDQKIL